MTYYVRILGKGVNLPCSILAQPAPRHAACVFEQLLEHKVVLRKAETACLYLLEY